MSSDIIDFHAHLPTGTDALQKLLDTARNAEITKTIIVPGNMLDSAYLGDFMRGTHSLRTVIPDNAGVIEASRRHPDSMLGFFNIDPAYHDSEDIAEASLAGFRGIKFNPIVHRPDLTGGEVKKILHAAYESSLFVVYTHITLTPETSLNAVIMLARLFPGLSFVIGHMGFATTDMAAIDAAQEFPNIFLESSIGSMLALQEIKRRGIFNKIVFGSEYPLHDPAVELYKLQRIFSGKEFESITQLNALQLLGGVR